MENTFQVLYVDDELELLELGKLYLEEAGNFSIVTENSAFEAFLLLNERRFDAIISDFQMPGMNGIDFLKKVRSSGNNIPFILFTGRGREDIVIQALNEGADFYLQKGGDPLTQYTELEHKVRHAINQKCAENELRESIARYNSLIVVSNTGA